MQDRNTWPLMSPWRAMRAAFDSLGRAAYGREYRIRNHAYWMLRRRYESAFNTHPTTIASREG